MIKWMKNIVKKVIFANLLLALANSFFRVYTKINIGMTPIQFRQQLSELGVFSFSWLTLIFGIVSLLVLSLSLILIVLFIFKKVPFLAAVYPLYEVSWQIIYFLILPVVSC